MGQMEKKIESPTKKFVVEKGGNPRGKTVSHEDVKQALLDIKEWYKAHAKGYAEKLATVKGVSEAEISKAESSLKQALPPALKALLLSANGSFQLLDTYMTCLLYTSPSPRDLSTSRMPSSA
eukprot:TRINITY_DN13751_c0_g1_i1.p2 TRINITY_DN13751_c0_g1~~TRINITY_DN13751_c0_g1_i1.p2  ORF type:complete len:122 (-),score=29.79 TRINITY_DN13751_c0_g1_i1:95-460(-)